MADKRSVIIAVIAAAFLLLTRSSYADILITVTDDGDSATFKITGSLDLTGAKGIVLTTSNQDRLQNANGGITQFWSLGKTGFGTSLGSVSDARFGVIPGFQNNPSTGAGTSIGFNGEYLFWDHSFGAEPGKITVNRTFTRTRYAAASFGVDFRNSKSPIVLWTHARTGETISIQNGNNLPNENKSVPQRLALHNTSFEEPRGNKGSFAFVESMPGWKTTDDEFEIWSSGFEGVEAHDGDQFVELNANIDGTLYQDLTGIRRGAALDFSFAHRGRNGDDTMKLTITDFGADNTIGNEDDVVLFVKEYTTGKDAWAVYDNANEDMIRALGNTVRFAYTAVHGTGGQGPDKTEGNFLDSVTFGIEVRNQPKRTFTAEQASKLLIGKWKANLKETESRYGELDPILRQVVEGGFFLDFTSNGLGISNGDELLASYSSYEVADADDGHTRVTARQDGVEEVEDLRIIDEYHFVLDTKDHRSHIFFDRYLVPEDAATRVQSTPVPMKTAGDSETVSGDVKEHVLTKDASDQSGAVWTQEEIDFSQSFRISADIFLGSKDGGADGMALVFQAGSNEVVSEGGGLGYLGITPSIAIEFDTYYNGDLNDPVEDHVGVRTNGDLVHTTGDYVEVGNLEDGKYHSLSFEWNAEKQAINLWLDGKQLFKEKSISKNDLEGKRAYFGFTAGTGGLSNLHKVRRINLSNRR